MDKDKGGSYSKKRKKIKINEFRPIAITSISYKIVAHILNKKVTEFLSKNKCMSEEQAGALNNSPDDNKDE